jgi:DNA repair exonuclease SbcCD ATPase subunit
MSTNPLPPKESLAQQLRRVAATLTDDAQNAALRKSKELGFDTNKGMISLEETLINLSEARNILLDAVDKGQLAQLPLRLQYALYEMTKSISQELTSLANGTDEITNLVDAVEDLTAEIWRSNLRNLSGEVLGLQNKLNQLKVLETRIRQVSREAEKFTNLRESAESSLDQISTLASEAAKLKVSVEATAEEISATLSKISDQSQKISSFAAQVDQQETTATQQVANTKQAAADTEASAKRMKELQQEVESDRAALEELLAQFNKSLSAAQESLDAHLAESKTKITELLSTTEESTSALTTRLDESIAEQSEGLKNTIETATAAMTSTEEQLKSRIDSLTEDTIAKLGDLSAEQNKQFEAQVEDLSLKGETQRATIKTQVSEALEKLAQDTEEQLTSQSEAFNALSAEWEGKAKQTASDRDVEYKKLVNTLDELEGRIRESIERATGYSLFQSFQKRQLDIAKAKRFWGYALGVVVLLSLGASAVFIYELRFVQVYNAAFYLKLSISLPLIYAIAFCNLQYSRERRLEEEYAFKSNISVSLDPYQKLVEKLVDKTKPDELAKYTAFVIESVNRVYTSPTGQIFEPAGDTNSAEKLIKALGEFIEPVIKGLKR